MHVEDYELEYGIYMYVYGCILSLLVVGVSIFYCTFELVISNIEYLLKSDWLG